MAEKKNIALFVRSYLPYSQTFIHDEIRAHSEKVHVSIFCQDTHNMDRFTHQPVYSCRNAIERMMYRNFIINPRFDKLLNKGSFDLVHAHFGTGAMYALPFARRHKLPLVVTFHGYDVAALIGRERNKYHNRKYSRKSRKIFEYASLLLAASTELKSLLIELGAPKEKVKVYRLGIDLHRFSYTEPQPVNENEPLRFLMIGRFTPKKGHIYSINAFKRLKDEGKTATMDFIGSGENEQTCKELVSSLGLEDSVKFLGIKSSEEISNYLSRSHVLVAPSVTASDHDRESGLIVIKEAAAVGLPSIGTWHGGIPEIIEDQKTGLLVPERNIDALFRAMKYMAVEPQKRVEMGILARKKMEAEYDLFERVKELETLYDQALSGS
ncbi:glycosyltransferase [Balneola sp. MJW-20]|uniref:glycosyltransferase n=1 Tax=Gracilimonas aurantiaca TaxID=3234185 RepID=UPI003464E8E7